MKFSVADYYIILTRCFTKQEVESVRELYNEERSIYSTFEQTMILKQIDNKLNSLKK